MVIIQWVFAVTEKFDADSGEWKAVKEDNYLMTNCFDLHRFFNLFTELKEVDPYAVDLTCTPEHRAVFDKVYMYNNIKHGDLMVLKSILDRRAFAGKSYRHRIPNGYTYRKDMGRVHYSKIRHMLDVVESATGTTRCKVKYICEVAKGERILYEPINSFVKEDGRKDV